MPALPKELYARFTSELGLGDYDAKVLTENREIAEFYMELTDLCDNYKAAANWTMGPVKTWLNNRAEHISNFPLTAATISGIIASIDQGIINNSQAEQKLFPALLEDPKVSVADMIEHLNIAQTGDDDVLQKLVDEVIAENPAKVEEYRAGKTGLMGMFMGQIMKKSQGKADPRKTTELLKQKLDA